MPRFIDLGPGAEFADLITTPGTIEVEWYHDFSTDGTYHMPNLINITPTDGG